MNAVESLKFFLYNATFTTPVDENNITHFIFQNNEKIHCTFWEGDYFITSTDILRILYYRFHLYGRPVINKRKFEEGVFSDLRRIKTGKLEEPHSKLLDFLFVNGAVRTKKKQRLYHWNSILHDDLFMQALQKDFKRESLREPVCSIEIFPPPTLENFLGFSNSLDLQKEIYEPTENFPNSFDSQKEPTENYLIDGLDFPIEFTMNEYKPVENYNYNHNYNSIQSKINFKIIGDYISQKYEIENNERQFTCFEKTCMKKFKRAEHLKRHVRIHTGERPFKCKWENCDKSFSRSDNLKNHTLVHYKNSDLFK
jgi:hypothetical protein